MDLARVLIFDTLIHPIKVLLAITPKHYSPKFDLLTFYQSYWFPDFYSKWNQLFETGLGQITIIGEGDIVASSCSHTFFLDIISFFESCTWFGV